MVLFLNFLFYKGLVARRLKLKLLETPLCTVYSPRVRVTSWNLCFLSLNVSNYCPFSGDGTSFASCSSDFDYNFDESVSCVFDDQKLRFCF